MADPEVVAIQNEWFRDVRPFKRWIIVERDLMFEIHLHTADGVAPMHAYPTKELAAARLLQLMGIAEPVRPQNWPEDVAVGVITIEKDDEHG